MNDIPNSTAPARRRFIVAACTLMIAGCAATAPYPDTPQLDRLLELIARRLSYMNDVARNKWNSGAPIEDLPREREIIDGLAREAPQYGVDPALARDFFRAQIEASKIIQRTRFAEWKAQGQAPFKSLPDLRESIRPALDALTPELMRALAAALPALKSPDAAALIRSRAQAVIPMIREDVPACDEAIAPLLRVVGGL